MTYKNVHDIFINRMKISDNEGAPEMFGAPY